MFSQTAGTDRQRLGARLVLALLVGFLVALVAFSGPNGISALAQSAATTSPTPTPTSQTIEFINPEAGTSFEVSEKPDGRDNAYHIVAAVGIVPTDAIVEFELSTVATASTPGRVLATYTASRVGTTDTFEFFWDTSDNFADGTYTLRAILFSGSRSEVSRDEEPITINNRGPDPTTADEDPQAETVEITYPLNAGPLGIFRSPDGSAANFVMDFSASSGTTFVTGFYSVTATGSEPNFIACTNGPQAIGNSQTTTTTPRSGNYRCRLAAADINRPVIATALVANDSPRANNQGSFQAAANDSGDGHRVFSYSQTPGTVRITPFQQSNATSNACAPSMTVTVLDQFDRQIAGQNVDVHAIGPSDQLRFDVSTGSDANVAPDRGDHTPDSAYSCSSNSTSGTQGEHNIAGGPDRKHIESPLTTTGGTSDTGTFRFRLFSDTTGTTQIVAWADSNNDDVCVGERAGAASIGWGVDMAAPTPTGEPEVSTCSFSAAPSPSPSGSPSGSPSSSPTGSTSPSPTPSNSVSQSPSPSGSPSGSPSATPSTSPSGSPTPRPECSDGTDNDGDGFTDSDDPSCEGPSDNSEAPQDEQINRRSRTLEITRARHVRLPGAKRPALLIKGQVASNDGFSDCEAQVPVKVQIRAGGEWITRKSDTTNDNGIFKVLIRDVPGRYRAVATKFQIVDAQNPNRTDVCLKAKDTIRHRH